MPRRMTDFLDEAVKTHPDKVAFTEEERSLTYKELQEKPTKLQCQLSKLDFAKNQWLFILISLFIVFHL